MARMKDTFYSNARLEHDESCETVIAINSFLMNTLICLTLENFGEFFKLPLGFLFNNITKQIGKELASKISLPFDMYLSCIFKCLNIPTNANTPLAINCQPISFTALHKVGFKMDHLIGNRVKDDHHNPQDDNDYDDIKEDHDDIPPAEHNPPPTSLFAQTSTPPLSDGMFVVVFSVITSLSEEFRGFRT
ncbi:hypothetical protein PVK06_048299 [Gossypium arboreum]|uniref:Uncharacterized protein n=1 Tax=Gossypium arboreum TaxID=29729 RepID=A0ABR0MG30_GOSAR|nr:hypothetical protein PVK06_048299 [Gossypium arboreum]